MAQVRRDEWEPKRILEGQMLVSIYTVVPYDFVFMRPEWITMTNQSGDFIRQFINRPRVGHRPALAIKMGRDFALAHALDILQFIEAELLFVSKQGAGRLYLRVEDGGFISAASDFVDLRRVREAIDG